MRRKSYLLGATAQREERHRRLVLFATGVLILLATSPVLVHHVGTQLEMALAGRDHLWNLCVIALHQMLAPVHQGFHLLLIGGLSYAAWDRLRAWLSVRRVLRTLEISAPRDGDAFTTAAEDGAVPTTAVRLVEGLPNPAFTAGWIRPRIYVNAGLAELLTRGELAAVVAHEYAHVRRRDPARMSVLRFVGCALFWLPALRRLAADVADDAEIAADDAAVLGQPLVLASAILALAHWRLPAGTTTSGFAAISGEASAVSGFQRDALLDRRIRRLAGEAAVVRSHVTTRSLTLALGALLLVWSSGLAVGHPLPTGQDAEAAHGGHCSHHRALGITHLFCFTGHPYRPGALCPHAAVARVNMTP